MRLRRSARSDPKESSKGYSCIYAEIAVVLLLLGSSLFQETEFLKTAPRSLSNFSIKIPRLSSVNSSGASGAAVEQDGFMHPIDCRLPIPHLPTQDNEEEESTTNSTCVRFFPERFFQKEASFFQQQYSYSKRVKTEHPIIHLTLQNESVTDPSAYPSSITYFHIRKCAGTTMFRSFGENRRGHIQLDIPYQVHMYNRWKIQELGIVFQIYHEQRRGGSNQPVPFSFIRDPVVRFLSSIGQVIHMNRVRLFPTCRGMPGDIQQEDDNTILVQSKEMVRCMIQSIKESQTASSTNSTIAPQFNYIDQHFLPQAYELRARSLEFDIGIHLMGMERISPTLKTLVGANRMNQHARSSRISSYTHGYNLETTILEEEMIRDICHLYAVDVLLLQKTGIATTLCDTLEQVQSLL